MDQPLFRIRKRIVDQSTVRRPEALDDGVLKIPPPILSRVYQTISRGFVNLLNTSLGKT